MDENLKEIYISTERIYEGKIVNLRRDMVRLPNGKEASREVVEHPGAVAVVPVLPDGRVLLVRQFRHPVARILLEIPAGKLDAGEDPDACALRELEEETGYRAAHWRNLGEYFSSPGMVSESFTLLVAKELTRIGDGGGVDSEDIMVHRISLDAIEDFVAAKRAEGCGIDVRIAILLTGGLLATRGEDRAPQL